MVPRLEITAAKYPQAPAGQTQPSIGAPGTSGPERAIVVVGVVSSARRTTKILDVLPEGREENSGDAPDVTIGSSDGSDAA